MNIPRKGLIGLGIILLLLVGGYYFFLPHIIVAVLSAEPRKPKLEVPEVSEIGWWPHQESLQVDSFAVEIVESELNLFNSKSLIRYRVKGHLVSKVHWKPSIKNVHVSQRFLRRYNTDLHLYHDADTSGFPEAIVEITPVIEHVNDESYNGEPLAFEFVNELRLESFHWGNNWLRFQCLDFWKDLTLQQTK